MAAGSGSLPRYIVQRVLLMIPMIWLIVTLVFIVLRVAPGDPVSASVGGRLSEDELDARRHTLGLDRPILVQYLDYLNQLLHFDLGKAISDNRAITDVIRDNGGATFTLTVGAFIVALLIGIPLGLAAGRYRDSPLDVSARLFGIVTYAAPLFFVGIMFITVAAKVGWPTSDIASPVVKFQVQPKTHILLLDSALSGSSSAFTDVLQHHLLPCITLGLLLCGIFIRLVRVNLLQTLNGDYVEAARARGIPERLVVRRHAFRNALVPVITVIGLQVALTLSGAVLTEKTFNWPGLGTQLLHYLEARDYSAVQGLVTFFAIIVVVVSLLVDIANAMIDPRVRY